MAAHDEDDAEAIELLRLMVRAAACSIHEYVDSPSFNWHRDKDYIRAAVDAATHLNAIMLADKEVT
jgi:hypothetical protein